MIDDPATRELIAALLYSPVCATLRSIERRDLTIVMDIDTMHHVDVAALPTEDPLSVPPRIAAEAWPRACRDGIVRSYLQETTRRLLAAVLIQQVAVDRRGFWVASRLDAGDGCWCVGPMKEWPAQVRHHVEAGRRVAIPLDKIHTAETIRGYILGPLAAWPVEV